ncbi:sensor histidine kinase [Hyalangium sp.]|uniref:sensor histidine kinase n=1 Tax=Hyalangium sp. TaxID=2028555 RepID=UPI002D2B414F|nr:ATP-binding protein [Hyalangium sp.]HYH95056.1 ATP-binding protein [Hyalangium sp.]
MRELRAAFTLDRKSLVFAAVLPLVSLLEFLALSHFSMGALAVRVAWALQLVVYAFWLTRVSESGRRLLVLSSCALGTLFYLALCELTGGMDSPYIHLVPTLPLLVAFIYPEEAGAAIVSGISCMLGSVVLVVGASPDRIFAWAAVVGTATFFGMYGASRFRKALAAHHEIQVERARREALEKLAVAERHRAQSEKLATVGRLAASVMHEINNPLAFVRSNVDFLKTEVLAQPLAPEVREELEEVLSETRSGLLRIQQIVSDLKGFSRMDVEEASPCRVADVVADAVRLADVRLKHVARLHVEVPDTLPEVFVTPQRLTQVVLNLLVNAGDALEEHRVAQGEIRVRGEVWGSRVVVLVEDNGPGFPPEVLPRLFEAFFTTKGPERGTGLGLSISRELVERFGGTLHAENRPEGGARLRVELPMHVPKPADATVLQSHETPGPRS